MDSLNLFLFVVGLALIIGGAEFLVRGASRLASAIGVSPLVIGLTVVGFGTASPELAVCIDAARSGHADITIGNIVGSNIANVLLILGISALARPLKVAQQLIRLEVPLMAGVSVLLLIVTLDRNLSLMDGLLFLVLLAIYLGFILRVSQKESRRVREEYEREFGISGRLSPGDLLRNAMLVAVGFGCLFVGTPWFVGGAIDLARAAGVSELVISLTVVSLGTSLPEVATSVLASLKGERDIAVGNVIGSNIFNILGVLGISACAAVNIPVPSAAITFDMPVMIAVALICLPVFFSEYVITRVEGALFLIYYGSYTSYLLLAATEHDLLTYFSSAVLYGLVPLTVIPIVLGAARGWWAMRRGKSG